MTYFISCTIFKHLVLLLDLNYQLFTQGDEDEESKDKLPMVKEEPRGRRQPQKQGSAIDLDIGPPLEPNQVLFIWLPLTIG